MKTFSLVLASTDERTDLHSISFSIRDAANFGSTMMHILKQMEDEGASLSVEEEIHELDGTCTFMKIKIIGDIEKHAYKFLRFIGKLHDKYMADSSSKCNS